MHTAPPTRPDLTIASVERETGLSKDTLRVWERRYGFPQPTRDAHGERTYPADQVDKLRMLKRLLDQGLRPGKLVSASVDELTCLLAEREAPSAGCAVAQGRCSALIDLLRLHRSDELRRALQQTLLKQGLQTFVADTVAPMNRMVGVAWLKGQIDVTEEHLYTEAMQNLLRSAINAQVGGGDRPRVLLTTFPDEHHGLGLLMAEAMLVPEGASCVSLGTQTPLTDIALAARNGGFDIVALSFSAAYPARQALEGLTTLRAALPAEVAIWAGGSGLSERHGAVGGVRRIDTIADTLDALQSWRAMNLQ